mmetsp:Transcript_30691/g.51684  ORF Transcript_30691/g.51684 Transcript_30691/m.51684 type:complete len:323 (+) Transcript_30691:276-1244(+)
MEECASGRWKLADESQTRRRSGHSASIVEDRMLIFGGNTGTPSNDVWEFDMSAGTWEMKEPLGEGPDERTYHSSVCYDRSMFVFGGAPAFPSFAKWGMGAGAGGGASKELHRYELASDTWEKIETGGTMPSGRHGHSALIAGDSMFIFGGYNGSSNNDLFRLNMNTREWDELKPQGACPCPRWRHAAVMHEGRMYIFGGNTRDTNSENLADMHCYDLERNEWSETSCKGGIPCARHDHTLVRNDRGMLLFGGNVGGRKDPHVLNDMYEFDFRANTWLRVGVVPPVPDPRAGHTAIGVPGGMCVFGGDGKDHSKLADTWMFSC